MVTVLVLGIIPTTLYISGNERSYPMGTFMCMYMLLCVYYRSVTVNKVLLFKCTCSDALMLRIVRQWENHLVGLGLVTSARLESTKYGLFFP
ncbi:hypothetical protein FKM82_017398 [Ascaphus truei]